MILLRFALLVLAIGNFGVQAAALAHPIYRDAGFSAPSNEIMPRLRRPVTERSERPLRTGSIAEGGRS
jgi:hypothetical protein